MKIQAKTEIKLQTFSAIFIKSVKSIVILYNLKVDFRDYFTNQNLYFHERIMITVKMTEKQPVDYNSFMKLFLGVSIDILPEIVYYDIRMKLGVEVSSVSSEPRANRARSSYSFIRLYQRAVIYRYLHLLPFIPLCVFSYRSDALYRSGRRYTTSFFMLEEHLVI